MMSRAIGCGSELGTRGVKDQRRHFLRLRRSDFAWPVSEVPRNAGQSKRQVVKGSYSTFAKSEPGFGSNLNGVDLMY